MADIAASDVTYTITQSRKSEDGRLIQKVTIAFGNSALTYPSGGVPLTLGKMGLPTTMESFRVIDGGGTGYHFDPVLSTNCLKIFQAPVQTHQHNFTVTKGAVLSSGEVGVSADAVTATINNNAIAATLALTTNTPIVSKTLAAAALSELVAATTAPAAQTLKCEVIGW